MYDIAVIGGGPGGYVAAIRAAQLGGKVLLIEKDKLGGVCLGRGCIPTKALLKSAERWRNLQHCAAFGLRADNIGFDFAAIAARKDQVVAQLQAGVAQLVAGNGIEVVYGTARLDGPGRLAVSGPAGEGAYAAGKIILAAGSEPMALPVPGADLPGVLVSDQLLALTEPPRSLAVVGAGAVGVEYASIFQAFGCQVTIIEMLPAILPAIDTDLVKRMALLLRKQGVRTLTGSRVTGITQGPGGLLVAVAAADGKEQALAVDKVLVATGRQPVVAGLGLETAGVRYDRNGVKVNGKMETGVTGIYAIGDMTGSYMWAHAASAEGLVAAENAMGGDAVMDYRAVPGCIFTEPEIATVGLTEQEALAAGLRVTVGRFNFAANGKAVSMGEADGLVKTVAAADGRLLGMHILGPHASDLVMEGAIAISHGLTAEDIGRVIHPHPTLSEAVLESLHAVDGRAIHQLRPRGRQRDAGAE